jgi:hypothetical protein
MNHVTNVFGADALASLLFRDESMAVLRQSLAGPGHPRDSYPIIVRSSAAP